jgi:predicted RNase H-like HicB family nuclease
MTYEVLVKQVANRFTATVLGLPGCTVEAGTRADAIQRARAAAATFIAEGELVQIEVEAPLPARPLSSFAGMWRNDETFEEFQEAIADHRREIDGDASQP